MTGKGKVLADLIRRRKVDVLFVQETREQSSNCTILVCIGRENGVGVFLNEEYEKNVVEVERVLDRVMSDLGNGGVMMNVVNGSTPQVNCEIERDRYIQK